MALLGAQLSRAGHRAVSGSLGRLGRRRRLSGFVGFGLTRLSLRLTEDGEAEKEEEDETARQDAHDG